MTSRSRIWSVDLERTIDVPLADVRNLLVREPTVLIDPAATLPDRRTGRVSTELRIPVGHNTVTRLIAIDVSPAQIGDDGVVITLRWEAAHRRYWFPKMAAYLAVADAGAEKSSLRLTGNYTVPLWWLGRFVHRVAGVQLAEASVAALFDQIVDRVTRATHQARGSIRWHPAPAPQPLAHHPDDWKALQ